MATQPIPNYVQASSAAAVLQGPLVARRAANPSSIRPTARREARQSEARQRLLLEMLPLVKRVAFQIRGHLPAHVEVDDLLANGVLGLVDAVSKFDTSKRVKLESYARHRIRGAILDGLRSADPASRDLRSKHKKVQKVYRELAATLRRPVKDEEIAAALGITLAQWHHTLNEIQSVGFDFNARTLSAGPNTKRPCAETEFLVDDAADPFERCYRREQSEILGRVFAHLKDRDRQIIDFYYKEELTMKQIAGRLNLDESRVSQLHSAALARLRASVNSQLLPRHAAASGIPTLSRAAGAGA